MTHESLVNNCEMESTMNICSTIETAKENNQAHESSTILQNSIILNLAIPNNEPEAIHEKMNLEECYKEKNSFKFYFIKEANRLLEKYN